MQDIIFVNDYIQLTVTNSLLVKTNDTNKLITGYNNRRPLSHNSKLNKSNHR